MRFYDRELEDVRSITEELLATIPDNKWPWEYHPIHQLAPGALQDLITYLRQEGILETDNSIRRLAAVAVDDWQCRGEMHRGQAHSGPMDQIRLVWRESPALQRASSAIPDSVSYRQGTLVVNLPPWLEPDEALWLAEKQIREQVEEIQSR